MYAYGQQAPEWLNTEPRLSQLVNAEDRHKAYRDIPQQKLLVKEVDLDQIPAKIAGFLGCDVGAFKKAARVSSRRVLDRDLLLYTFWQLGVRTNSQLGKIFGLTGYL